jgi:transposase
MDVASGAYRLYVGVEVAADTFTASWLAPGGAPTVPCTGEQTPAGYAALQRRLQATRVAPASTLVVLEATGNYWVALAVALHEAGYRVAVVNPRQAHHFAKAQLRRAKTDALDAQDLCAAARKLLHQAWALGTKQQHFDPEHEQQQHEAVPDLAA